MNELSWLIYAADVANDVNAVCGFTLYGGAIGLCIYAVAKGIGKAVNLDYEDIEPITPSIASVCKKAALPILAAGVVGVLAPSSNTLYAIAASEMGERVIASETAGKAVQALNAWLDRQITAEAAK